MGVIYPGMSMLREGEICRVGGGKTGVKRHNVH